jgi:murein L,D-transpeptidase YafK
MQPERAARYQLFRSYDICNFSGTLGPKLFEGDEQAPEGFYRIARAQLNPASRHHLAFNLGFPNAFDRQLARTGSALMVHGGCTSIGCYAIGDESVDEVYAVIEAAMDAGQTEIDVAALPFEMNDTALAAHAGGTWDGFWRNLKAGADLFARDGVPPRVAACNGQYRFGEDANGEGCVPIAGWV